MILTPTTGPAFASPDDVASDSAYVRKASEVVANAKPDKSRSVGFRFERELLPLEGGQLLLRLRQRLLVEFDPMTRQCGVADWDVRLPITQVGELTHRLARQFLILFSKADSGQMNEQESNIWLKIVDQVDYRRFCIDRAAPQYIEGRIESKQLKSVRVRWHDDEVQKLERPIAAALDVLQPGDQFGAYVKLGIDNQVLSIERLSILP